MRSQDMPVFLVEYDAAWPVRFEAERARIEATLGSRGANIEHIGSTAIAGMAAKPIIDIMALIPDVGEWRHYADRLGTLDYHYFPYGEDQHPERRWFCKPGPTERTHHLHLVEWGSLFHRDHLMFRDYLRTHADAARDYEDLKRRLARQFPTDRDAYTDGKTDFVTSVLRRAHPGR